MQNGGEGSQAAAESTAAAMPEEITKQAFRLKVWKHLEKNGLAMFPRPVYSRIPNFKGAQEAAAKFAELDVFKNATHVFVNPDKPQEAVRMLCLESNKTLYVPVPRHSKGFLNRLELPEGEKDPAALKKAVYRNGMETYGKTLGLEEKVNLDIMVMGCVAVSKEGYRIGKGLGYGDLEFGLLMHMKAIHPGTVVVTIVHDSQVFNTLPNELFKPHDALIDLIVTPTQVIETQRLSQRPSGILWHLLSNRRLAIVPVLIQLRELEVLAGHPCTLKEEDTDVEDHPPQRPRRYRRRTRSHKSQTEGEKDEGNTTEGEAGDSKDVKPRRNQRRRKSVNKDDKVTPTKPRRARKPRPLIEFSVKISNISPNSRVRELKQALTDRGVKPQIMVWKGFKGFCYLHFLKPQQKGEGDVPAPLDLESVLTALEEMSLHAETEDKPRVLTVEPAPPRAEPEAQEEQAV